MLGWTRDDTEYPHSIRPPQGSPQGNVESQPIRVWS